MNQDSASSGLLRDLSDVRRAAAAKDEGTGAAGSAAIPGASSAQNGRGYWRSIEEYAQTPEFQAALERDFPSVAEDATLDSSRRDFLKLMGASLGMAGLTACSWPEERILPFTNRPEGRLPGVPVYYATTMELSGVGRGLLVKSYDGRPVKVEGNPIHPESQGASDLLSQASVLDLYDPDRSRQVWQRESGQTYERTWAEFETAARALMMEHGMQGGRGLAVLSEATSSPTLLRLRGELLHRNPEAKWFEYEAVSHDAAREATRGLYGRALRVQPAYDSASVILSLDEDFLVTNPVSVRWAFDWAQGRIVRDGHMNRLYVVEGTYSATGGVADHRLPLKPSEIPTFAAEVASALLSKGGLSGAAADALRGAAASTGKYGAHAENVAEDLLAHRGTGLVVVGPRQPASLHALALLMNEALGNVGRTVTLTNDPQPDRATHLAAINELAQSIQAGAVQTLLMLGGNPVHDAPSDLGFGDLLAKVPNTIRLGLHEDETSARSAWHLPRAHYLESWGDTRAWDGTVCVVQPLIRPLYDGRTPIEVVSAFITHPAKGYDLVRQTMEPMLAGSTEGFEGAWRRLLHDGVLAGSEYPAETVAADPMRASLAVQSISAASISGLEAIFTPDTKLFDGRFANNPWLQELPESMTKMGWDNAAWISPRMANEMGVQTGDMLRIEQGGRSIEIAAWVQPGHAAGAVTLPLGYGRTLGGKIATGSGFDVYPLRTSEGFFAAGVQVQKTGQRYDLSTSQDHFPIDKRGAAGTEIRLKDLVREATLTEHLHPHDDHHAAHPPVIPLWDEHKYDGQKWGLSIDLSACTGCNACVIACQSENNIPIVGKNGLGRGREMHWIRIDRYFRGDPEDAGISMQPVTCHHCETAPCEQVCPVAATVHSAEGLNDMVYNRCIGTRYCQNNCPYKVRRFNYFAYNASLSPLERMQKNPDVTVRSRGVMEKCTFCVQRIAGVRIQAKNERRPIRDGEITTACAQACPTRAITFGDLNDPASQVRLKHDDARSYGMLDAMLYTKPRLHYLTRLKNPNPALAGGGEASGEHHG